MADNTVLNAGSGGDTIATDDIGGTKHQYVKMEYGADNSATPVSTSNPLPVRLNGATGTLSNVASSTSSVTALASNASRLRAFLFNDSTSRAYIKFGATASSTSFTKFLLPGEFFEVSWYTGIIDAIWESANGNMRVTEITA